MKCINIKLFAIAIFLFMAQGVEAAVDTVTINGVWYYGSTWTWSVTFTGNVESNGNINLSDLSALNFSDSSFQQFTLANVNAFGTFDTLTATWLNNASDWYGTKDAYLTSNYFGGDYSWSLNTVYFEQPVIITSISQSISPVPEPETYTMILVGLVGVGLAQRRKAKVVC